MPLILNMCENCSRIYFVGHAMKCMMAAQEPLFKEAIKHCPTELIVGVQFLKPNSLLIWFRDSTFSDCIAHQKVVPFPNPERYIEPCEDCDRKFAELILRLWMAAYGDEDIDDYDENITACVHDDHLIVIRKLKDRHDTEFCRDDAWEFVNKSTLEIFENDLPYIII